MWYVANQLGGMNEWWNSDYPDWAIFEQPKGFYIWKGFKFLTIKSTMDEAKEYVSKHGIHTV